MPGCGHKEQWFFPFLFFLVVLRLIPFKGYFSSWNFSKANWWYFYCSPWHDRKYSLKCFCQLPSTISFLLARLLVTCVLVAQSCPILCNPVDWARQTPLSVGFSRQEYWNGLPCLPPGDLPDPGFEPASLVFLALGGRFFTTDTTWEAQLTFTYYFI